MTRAVLRGGLALLGVLHLSWGVAATAAPRWFFDTFPGFGGRWTAAYPPFNEHLMTDVGAAFAALGFLLLAAAVLADRRVTTVVLLGVIVFSGLHLAFHAGHRGELTGTAFSLSLASLAAGVLAPVALLFLANRAGGRGAIHRPDRVLRHRAGRPVRHERNRQAGDDPERGRGPD